MAKIIVVPHYEGTEDFKTLMKRVLSYEISNQYKIRIDSVDKCVQT